MFQKLHVSGMVDSGQSPETVILSAIYSHQNCIVLALIAIFAL